MEQQSQEKFRSRFQDEERGANALEYALLGVLIAVVCVSAVTLLGRELSESFSRIGSGVAN